MGIGDAIFDKNDLVKHLGEHNPDDFLLLTMVGSRAFNLEDENSDFDMCGIVYDNYVSLFGTKKHKRESVFPNIYEEKKEDIVIYTLRDFVINAANGSPSALELLGNDNYQYLNDKNGIDLYYLSNLFLYKNLYHSYMGYLNSNFVYFKGNIHSGDIVGANKCAANILRICEQLRLILEENVISNKISNAFIIKKVKEGEFFDFSCQKGRKDYCSVLSSKKEFLKNLYEKSNLPEKPNIEKINNWLVKVYKQRIVKECLAKYLEEGE